MRSEWEAKVRPITTSLGPYSVVSHTDALSLLGEERFGLLLKDATRGKGPSTNTFYPWNVVDYLDDALVEKIKLKHKPVKAYETDLDECRDNLSKLKLYVMHEIGQHYICVGTDPVAASQNLKKFGVEPERLGVSQSIVLSDQLGRKIDTSIGVFFPRPTS